MGGHPAKDAPRPPAPPTDPRRDGAPSAAALPRRALEERKRAFMRLVGHELRTPLNSIIGFSEIIACELYGTVSEPRYREHAQIVRDSGLKMLKLVNEVMEIARLEAGMADLDPRAEPLRPAVDETLAALTTEARGRGVSFSVEIAPDAAAVLADPRGLRSILSALLENAVTCSADGGQVFVSARRRGRSVLIEIRDQGQGVDAAGLARPLEQGRGPLSRHVEGAGLGLPLARLLCRAMGGALRLQSSPGQGLVAGLRLPHAVASVPDTAP